MWLWVILVFSFIVLEGKCDDIYQSSEEGSNITTLLPSINIFTYDKGTVDISLYKINETEDCYIITKEGTKISFDELRNGHESITPHDSSDYVSCRFTISPMEEHLLGHWTLVGFYEKDGIKYERKQDANISWRSNVLSYVTLDTINFPVHYDGLFNPAITSFTSPQSCHIITPNGEDLLILTDSKYPNIKRDLTDRHSVCSVILGPIQENMLGNWTIYGIFSTIFPDLVQRQFHLHLYDNENPYDQAYNRTVLDTTDRIVNLDTTIKMEVTNSGSVDKCIVKTPHGKDYDLHRTFNLGAIAVEEIDSSCRIAIGPITKEMLGDWVLITKFSDRNVFTEKQQPFTIIQEDPANPIEYIRREVIELNHEFINTHLGEQHRVTITTSYFIQHDTCHIRTPDGLQYTIMDGFNIPGVEIIESNSQISCGVTINILSEELIGNWTLIARETQGTSTLLERRLPFTIYVEEFVPTSPSEVTTVGEGNDFYLRLAKPTDLHNTCTLISPNGEVSAEQEIDKRFVDSCGFIVRNTTVRDNGIWEIKYGTKVIYRAQLRLNVQETPRPIISRLTFIRDRPVDVQIGQNTSVFCRVEDPFGEMMYDGFGICRIVLDRVTDQHGGLWKAYVTSPGYMLSLEYDIIVTIQAPEPQQSITTNVIMEEFSSVLLSCSVSSVHEIRTCKFRDPWGRIVIANHGVGEDRYSFHGIGISSGMGMYHADCGLRIQNPQIRDLGLWRCAIETSHETYFDFLSVLCPWSMADPTIAQQVETEPVLRAKKRNIKILAGDNLKILCKVSAPIRYCYFRSDNGSVISVSPGISKENYKYVGEGFKSGECGIMIQSSSVRDDGPWTCNVGFTNVTTPEQRDTIDVKVLERLVLKQQLLYDYSMTLSGTINQNVQIEYCRFVRSDGFAFTFDNLPTGYIAIVDDHQSCAVSVARPSARDRDIWLIAVKIATQSEELTAFTASVAIDSSPVGIPLYSRVSFYFTIGIIGFITILSILFCIIPSKKRQTAFNRIDAITVSTWNSFRKKPLLIEDPSLNIDINKPSA